MNGKAIKSPRWENGKRYSGFRGKLFLKISCKNVFYTHRWKKGKHSAAFMKEMKKVSFKLLFRMPNWYIRMSHKGDVRDTWKFYFYFLPLLLVLVFQLNVQVSHFQTNSLLYWIAIFTASHIFITYWPLLFTNLFENYILYVYFLIVSHDGYLRSGFEFITSWGYIG